MESSLLEIKYTRIKGLLKEQEENNDGILKNTLLDLNIIVDGTFTFGTGITAFLPIVRDLINQQQPHITEQTIGLLYITAMWIILNRHGDKVKKLIQIIREQGLTDALSKIIDFLKSLEDVVLKVADEVGYAASTIADVGAFTFLAFPLLDGLTHLVGGGEITFGEPSGYLKSVLISVGILTIKNVFNSVIKKVKSRFGTLDESQHIMKYNDLGIGSDVLSVVRKTLFVESSELWVLPKDINADKKYIFNGLPHTINLHISRNSKLKENYSINITEEKTNNFKVVLEINPLTEPKVYKNIKLTLKECFGKYGYPPISMTLNEQSENRTVRNVFEDSDYKILVPLTMESFCQLVSDTPWCTEYQKERLSKGTNYILYNKNTNKKTLIHDMGRVFLLRDGNASKYQVTLDRLSHPTVNIKRFLSEAPQLSEFFNITYTATDNIKYGRAFTSEELLELSTTNKFSQAVYDVISGASNIMGTPMSLLQQNIDRLSNFLGNNFIEGNEYDNFNDSEVLVDFKDSSGFYGVSLFFSESLYENEILNIEEDDSYYYSLAMDGVGHYDTDSLEWEEMDYLCDKIDKVRVKKLHEILKLLDSSIEEATLCDEGVLTDLLSKYFDKEWEHAGDEILYELGVGLAEYRAKDMKEIIEEDLILTAESISGGYQLDITYHQLLGLINQFNLKTFSDLLDSGFNEIDTGLNDIYYDSWGYGDDTIEQVGVEIDKFLDVISEDGEMDFTTRKKHYEEFDRVIKTLGFTKGGFNKNYVKQRTLEDWTGNNYTIYYQLSNYDPINNTIMLYVGLKKPSYYHSADSQDNKTYQIKISEVSDYVLSEDLFAPESVKIRSGQYNGDTEILKSREEPKH